MINAKGKVSHICNLDKFIPSFIDFVEEHFDDFATRHVFFITGDIHRYSYGARANTHQAQLGKKAKLLHLVKLAGAMQQSDKIILHGLFNKNVVLLLFLMPWLLKKCYWVMWGGDYYVYQFGNRNSWRWKVSEFFRRPVIKKMGNLVNRISGDIELTRKWYEAQGRHIQCFCYPSNTVDTISDSESNEQQVTSIIVGNSADPSNNHKESLDKLLPYKDYDIKIYCPLSYGNQEYAADIIAYGKAIFGEKFYPLTKFMKIDEYMKLLQKIDIAIFNHKRQQAFGNILMLLGYGKKVFIRKESTLNETFLSIGIELFDSRYIDIEKIKPEVAAINKDIIINNFSKENLAESLKRWMS